jgi:DNA-binding NarL/FixJ family response regulator
MALRALIVDDNGHFLLAARDLLEREGIEVVAVASTGAQAIRLASELKPDVTLLDIDLGQESGFDVAKALAEERSSNGVPVVLISTYAERDFADLIAASPAVGFVSKSDLSARTVHEVLEGT